MAKMKRFPFQKDRPVAESKRAAAGAKGDPILSPVDFVRYCRMAVDIGQKGITDVLLCYDDDLFDALRMELARHNRIGKNIGGLILLKGSPMLLAGRFGIGAPAVVAKCEELIACGVKRIISVGTAASLTRELAIGDVVVCEKAFSDEGTSRHYVPGRRVFQATQGLAHEIRRHFMNRGIRTRAGATWTTDAPYRETPKERDAFVAKGAKVVEMEAAALYMLAAYRQVDALSVFVVGDSIAESTWRPCFNDNKVRLKLRKAGTELLRFMGRKFAPIA